tara:strand:+ start:655 stop:771 length:117 start_codon:yes stop_codon:yes gene_type:complete
MKQHQQQQFQPSNQKVNKSVIKEERKLNNNNISSSIKD